MCGVTGPPDTPNTTEKWDKTLWNLDKKGSLFSTLKAQKAGQKWGLVGLAQVCITTNCTLLLGNGLICWISILTPFAKNGGFGPVQKKPVSSFWPFLALFQLWGHFSPQNRHQIEKQRPATRRMWSPSTRPTHSYHSLYTSRINLVEGLAKSATEHVKHFHFVHCFGVIIHHIESW